MPTNANAIVEPPPDAATADDHRNPRRRRREAEEEAPEVGLLIHPDSHHDLDGLVLHASVRTDILAGLRAIEVRDELERVWQISPIEPQQERCILNFCVPPGTGKTRAALGVALRLGKPLYQIDCSTVISKYLGDTAERVKVAFAQARENDAVLFFDVADSR